MDIYYSMEEVSNSDLGLLESLLFPKDRVMDLTAAYRLGNLVDAMITEEQRVNFLGMTFDGECFQQEEFQVAYAMRNSFLKDYHGKLYYKMSVGQRVFTNPAFTIAYDGVVFSMPVRCKYDLWSEVLEHGADIKSTVSTTQKQFEDSLSYFNYDRQRAWYMDISGAKRDVLFGISKRWPHNIFKKSICRGDKFYLQGKAKYQQVAWRYFTLLEGLYGNT